MRAYRISRNNIQWNLTIQRLLFRVYIQGGIDTGKVRKEQEPFQLQSYLQCATYLNFHYQDYLLKYIDIFILAKNITYINIILSTKQRREISSSILSNYVHPRSCRLPLTMRDAVARS